MDAQDKRREDTEDREKDDDREVDGTQDNTDVIVDAELQSVSANSTGGGFALRGRGRTKMDSQEQAYPSPPPPLPPPLPPSSPVRINRRQQKSWQWLLSLAAVSCKGFAVGAGLHGGVRLVVGITNRQLFKNPWRYLTSLPSVDALRFASFLALSSATYKASLSLLQSYCKQKRGWQPTVAGFLAGLTCLLDDPSRRHTLTLFLSARALGVLVLTLHRRGYLPTVSCLPSVLFATFQSFIILCVAHYPYLMPRGYYLSVLRWSQYYTDEKLRMFYRQTGPSFLPCQPLMHGGTCHAHGAGDLFRGLWFFSKIYLTLYSIPLLLFRTKKLLQQPKESVQQLLSNTWTSALFFAVDAALTKYMLCLLRNLHGGAPPAPKGVPILAGLVGSVGILIERKSRRMELVYYTLTQVLYSFWRLLCIKKPLHLDQLPYGSLWLFSISLAILMHAHESPNERDFLAPLINKALDLLLGD